MGSNPIPSIESSVRIPANIAKPDEYTNQYLSAGRLIHTSEYGLRDLYNREKQLERWIHKVNTDLDEPDRTDIFKLVTDLQDDGKIEILD